MRKLLLLLIFFGLQNQKGFCQVAAIQLAKQNVLYLGIANPFSVAVENSSSSSIILTAENGEIRNDSTGRPGHYNFWPNHVGNAEIKIQIKTAKGTKVLNTVYYRVKRLTVVPLFAGKSGGELSASFARTQIAPMASCGWDDDMCGRAQVIRTKVIVTRQGNVVYEKTINDDNGVRFDDATKSFFNTLRKGDKLLFVDIKALAPDGERNLPQMEFSIL